MPGSRPPAMSADDVHRPAHLMEPADRPPDPTSTVLDPELCAFVRGGVSIGIATRDAALRPHAVRALGTRLDGRSLVLLVPRGQARAVLDDVAANGQIAVVFSRPSTHRTYQLKGDHARIVPVEPGDAAIVRDSADAFSAELALLGYPRPFVDALLAGGRDELVGIAFTPASAFDATPGPRSGDRLAGSR
jgi:hypothetical protein